MSRFEQCMCQYACHVITSLSFPTAFTITIPCTRGKTGIASMYLSLAIGHSDGHEIDGSPLKLHIRKRCIAAGM